MVWMAECTSCHGPSARGSETVPSLIRSLIVLRDRQGNALGPFLKQGHPTQSGRPSPSLTDAEIADLMQFLRQRINDTLRGSPVFDAGNVVTGDAKAGAAYFAGAGACTKCHAANGDLADIAARLPAAVDLQQRMLFPTANRSGIRAGRGAAPPRTAITVTITPPGGPAVTGTVVERDDFFVSYRDAAGAVRTVRRAPGTTIVINDPLQAHHDWLSVVTDRQIHDLVAYLVTLK